MVEGPLSNHLGGGFASTPSWSTREESLLHKRLAILKGRESVGKREKTKIYAKNERAFRKGYEVGFCLLGEVNLGMERRGQSRGREDERC